MSCSSRAAFIVGGVEISQTKSRPTEAARVPIAGVEKDSPVAGEVTAAAEGLETHPVIYDTSSTAAKAVASAITGNGTLLRNVWRSAFRMIAAVASRLVDRRPYDDVSEGREVSFILASNGPLLYRLKRRNPDPPENRGN
jgi:hypothetical protein